MKFYCFCILFVSFSILKNVKSIQTAKQLHQEAVDALKKLEDFKTTSMSKLNEELENAKKSCLDLKAGYLNTGSTLMDEIKEKLVNYMKNLEKSQTVFEDKQQKVNEMILVQHLEYTKCIAHPVEKTIQSINTEMKNMKKISDYISDLKSGPDDCLAKDESRAALFKFIRDVKNVHSDVLQNVSLIGKGALDQIAKLSKNLQQCTPKIVGYVIKAYPQLVAAVHEESKTWK